MVTISSHAEINSVYWITSLEPDKQGTTRRIHEDLAPFFQSSSVFFKTFQPQSAIELNDLLDRVALEAINGRKPIIHLDTHGSKDDEILISASGEFINWRDICAKLQKINVATGNNLCVVSAACFGSSLAKEISIAEPCPFFLMIAPDDIVTFGFMEAATVAFYKAAFEHLDIVSAYDQYFRPGLSLFHSEVILALALARYFRDQCMGAEGRKRREKLVTLAVASGVPNTRHNRRLIRSRSKSVTRPNKEVVDRYASNFLHGKRNFEFNDLIKIVEQMKTMQREDKLAQRHLLKARLEPSVLS